MPEIRVVTTRLVKAELATAASVDIYFTKPDGSYDIPTIGPITVDRLARFFVIATLILGGADALMLAALAVGTNVVRFPGWEIL